MSRNDNTDEIHKHSGWLIPLGVFVVVFALSAMFLLFYLAPTPPALFQEQVSPTSSSDIVELSVHGLRLSIPANYLEYKRARDGGERKEIALFALLPDMTGWSNWDAQSFTGNAADFDVVYFLIREQDLNLTEADRLRRIFLAYVVDPKGTSGPFGLTQYVFRDDFGYHREDLFVGETEHGPMVLRCVRFSPEVPSPSCLRDVLLTHGVALSYRFKRAHLAQWQEIGTAIDKLMAGFRRPAK